MEANKLNELNEEQIAALSTHKDFWVDKIFKYQLHDRFNPEETIQNMKELYKMCGLAEPVVLVVDSPYACQLAVSYFEFNENQKDIKDGYMSKEDLAGIKKEGLKYYEFSSYINYSDFGWLSYYDYFLKYTNIIDDQREKFEQVVKFVESSFTSIQLEGLCVVSNFPSKIVRNANNNLHNIDDYAIEFKDGYALNYYNGIYVENKMFNKLLNKEYTFEEFTKEENEETKSLILAYYEEKFGGEFVFRFISKNLKEVDTYVDKKKSIYLEGTVDSMNVGVYTLYKGEINSIEIAYVRCYCPSTDRMFFLGVEPTHEKAEDAIASLCQVPKGLHKHLTAISRQGEIFSFNFDEIGTNKLKTKDINLKNVVSLSGKEYFKKIKFEY